MNALTPFQFYGVLILLTLGGGAWAFYKQRVKTHQAIDAFNRVRDLANTRKDEIKNGDRDTYTKVEVANELNRVWDDLHKTGEHLDTYLDR